MRGNAARSFEGFAANRMVCVLSIGPICFLDSLASAQVDRIPYNIFNSGCVIMRGTVGLEVFLWRLRKRAWTDTNQQRPWTKVYRMESCIAF
jgi:hypothetical protein